ncbi:MAG TPA: HlyC/CorC family transporter [candidate division WWE3 bacterium]|uniref:HlyC/CorC family transporter n=1 Tax=candidate division WWE3 bacterium TaxID=2053526 RepID=A0A7V5MIM4_UNCKA|nr:HlyC/CorC family transporter [candidate division WWE3 bacterium]
MDSTSSYTLVLLALILLSGVFSGAEIAFFSISKASLYTLVRKKYKGSDKLLHLKKNPDRLLITILIGNNIVNIASSSLATYLATTAFGSAGVGIATGIMTLLILTFGEILPKSLFSRYSQSIALILAPFFYYLQKLFYPFSFLFEKLLDLLSKAFLKNTKKTNPLYKEDIKSLAYLAYQEGLLVKNEHKILKNVLRFSKHCIEDIAVPLDHVHYLYEEKTLLDYQDYLKMSPYSRIPVLSKSLKIIGILYLRDLTFIPKNKWKSIKVKDICKPAVTVDYSKNLNYMLNLFKKTRTHMAIVMKDKKVYGIVTLEDVLERLVGDIQDETDLPIHHSKTLLKKTRKI